MDSEWTICGLFSGKNRPFSLDSGHGILLSSKSVSRTTRPSGRVFCLPKKVHKEQLYFKGGRIMNDYNKVWGSVTARTIMPSGRDPPDTDFPKK